MTTTLWLALAGWLCGWLLAARPRSLPAAELSSGLRVSIVVPARNEARRLPELLTALASDPPDELLVVDDGSTDDTAELARAGGATVIDPGAPPHGWTGKAWACQQGARAAAGDVLVFLDADTRPEPGFPRRLAGAAVAEHGLVSVQPWHRTEAVYERLSAVCNTVALMAGTGRAPRRQWWRGPVAFGPAVAIGRQQYLDTGGHGLVPGEVAEDVALAAALDGRGVPVAAYAARGVTYRMYPEGLGSLVEGWSKNLAAGAGRIPPLRAIAVAVWVTGSLVSLTSLVAFAAFVVQMAVLFRRAGRFGPLTALLYVVPLALFIGCFARSAVARLLGHDVRWRGRMVPS